MATKRTIVYICDTCGAESEDPKSVHAHAVVIDRNAVVTDQCTGCWEANMKTVEQLFRVGRTAKIPAALAKELLDA